MSPKRCAAGVLVQVVFQAPCSHAFDSYQDDIPNGKNVKGCDGESCVGVGHVNPAGRGARNSFGLDFKTAKDAAGVNPVWTVEFCNKDSDGDGESNGVELGDPKCTWVIGETPERTDGITHPGIDCSVPRGFDSQSILLLHGIFMILAWALTLPMGAAVPMVWRRVLGDPKWFMVHQSLQLLGGLFVLVGFGLAVSQVDTHFWGPDSSTRGHKFGGLIVVLLTLVQMVGARLRPDKPHGAEAPSPARSNWLLSHRVIGGTLLVYCVVHCLGGIGLYGERPSFLRGLLVAFLGATVAFVAVGAFSRAGKKDEDQVELKEQS